MIAKAKKYSSRFFVIFLSSILALSLFVFYIPASFSADEDDTDPEKKSRDVKFLKNRLGAGFQCDRIETKDKNIALCKESGVTKPFMIVNNGMNGMNSVNSMNGMDSVNSMNGKSCPTQTENIPLAGGIEPQGIRVLADLDPCTISDGSITLNIPYTSDIKVAVMYLDKTGNNHQTALIDPTPIQMLSNGQGLFKLDLNQLMTGKDTNTGQIITLGKINGLALYNSGVNQIPFGPSNSAALTTILAPGQMSGALGLPHGNIMGKLPGPNLFQTNIPGNQLVGLGGSNSLNSFSSSSSTPFPNQFSSSSAPPPYSPPANTVAPAANQFSSSSVPANTVAENPSFGAPSLSIENIKTLNKNQLIDAISIKVAELRNFDKNKITQALFDLTQITASKGGDVMKNLRLMGTTIIKNPSAPLVNKIINIAQTK
ncbi:MAG TPA: hypothetical protein VFV86_09520 [Nitrososphaeraceae archaeon]|nr:hypothetical protein [Nitrososphaeraceae archaeon]